MQIVHQNIRPISTKRLLIGSEHTVTHTRTTKICHSTRSHSYLCTLKDEDSVTSLFTRFSYDIRDLYVHMKVDATSHPKQQATLKTSMLIKPHTSSLSDSSGQWFRDPHIYSGFPFNRWSLTRFWGLSPKHCQTMLWCKNIRLHLFRKMSTISTLL